MNPLLLLVNLLYLVFSMWLQRRESLCPLHNYFLSTGILWGGHPWAFPSPGTKDLTPSVFPHRAGSPSQSFGHICGPSLDSHQSVCIFFVLWRPELDTVSQVHGCALPPYTVRFLSGPHRLEGLPSEPCFAVNQRALRFLWLSITAILVYNSSFLSCFVAIKRKRWFLNNKTLNSCNYLSLRSLNKSSRTWWLGIRAGKEMTREITRQSKNRISSLKWTTFLFQK